MSKKIFQDIVKVKHNLNYKYQEDVKIPIIIKNISKNEEYELEQNNNGSKYGLWFIALFSVIFLIFSISFLFSGAKITINPKTQNLVLNQNLNAIKNSNNDNLSFNLVSISGEEIKKVQGGEIKDVAEKAKGTVRIFNAFSSSPQTLSINTRLEGSNQKIYKTVKKIIIPGISSDDTPGSVEIDIVGAEAGEEYNSIPLDFKIFGLKGTPKYSKIFAKSVGEIKGGLKDKFSQVSNDQKVSVVNELRNTLKEKLLKKVINQIPNGYVLFKDAVFVNDDGGNVGVSSEENLVPITLKGTLYGFLFKEEKLTEKIIKENIKDYDKNEVYISNIQSLTFSLDNKENISFKDVENISFNLSGSTKIVWKIDIEKLVADLLGKKKRDFNQILSQYTNVDSADSVVKPIWARSFPDKSKNIKVIVNYPE